VTVFGRAYYLAAAMRSAAKSLWTLVSGFFCILLMLQQLRVVVMTSRSNYSNAVEGHQKEYSIKKAGRLNVCNIYN